MRRGVRLEKKSHGSQYCERCCYAHYTQQTCFLHHVLFGRAEQRRCLPKLPCLWVVQEPLVLLQEPPVILRSIMLATK